MWGQKTTGSMPASYRHATQARQKYRKINLKYTKKTHHHEKYADTCCTLWQYIQISYVHRARKKNLQFSLNNLNKFKRIFTMVGTDYPEDTFY